MLTEMREKESLESLLICCVLKETDMNLPSRGWRWRGNDRHEIRMRTKDILSSLEVSE
jgi:hypothetical protein